MEALNDIGASEFLGIRTLTVSIYTTWATRMSVEGAAQIALVMLAFVFALILLERWARRRQRFAAHAQPPHTAAPQPLGGSAAAAAMLACALPIAPRLPRAGELSRRRRHGGAIRVAGLPQRICPTGSATRCVRRHRDAGRRPRRPRPRLFRAPVAQSAPRRSSCGSPRHRLRHARHGARGRPARCRSPRSTIASTPSCAPRFGISTGLLLTGSGAALVLAYVLRFLAISAGGIEAGLAKVSPHLDMAARCLGSRPARCCGVIHLPLLAPGPRRGGAARLRRLHEGTAGDAALRPFNFKTLATALYGEAKRGTYEDGAIAALAIVLVGLIPVIVLARVNAGMDACRAPVSGGRESARMPRILTRGRSPGLRWRMLPDDVRRSRRKLRQIPEKLQRLGVGERLACSSPRAHARRRAPRAR